MAAAKDLYGQVIALPSLTAAWEDILDRGDNGEGQSDSIARFLKNADENLTNLHAGLVNGTYRPASLFEMLIPKDSGAFRSLSVPPVRDRIVERALLDVVTPFVDPWLGPSSYAYRPGLGVADAIQEVARLRDEGLPWVLRADIEECFPSIPRTHAVRKLTALLPDTSLDVLVGALANRPVITRRGLRETTGVPQGASLSPMLANLVLTHLDDALLNRGVSLVRYADDFTVVCASRDDAWEAARTATTALKELGCRSALRRPRSCHSTTVSVSWERISVPAIHRGLNDTASPIRSGASCTWRGRAVGYSRRKAVWWSSLPTTRRFSMHLYPTYPGSSASDRSGCPPA